MTRFVAIWSLQRGSIDPPEPLDETNQFFAQVQAYADAYEDAEARRIFNSRGFRNQTSAQCA